MGAGVLNGLILGLVVAGVVLGAVSLSTPLPERPGEGFGAEPAGRIIPPDPVPALPAPETPAVPPAGTAAGTSPETAAETAPAADAIPQAATAPVPMPEPDLAPPVEPDAVPEPSPEPSPAPEAASAPPAGDTLGTAVLSAPSADPAPRLPRADTPPQATSPVPPAPVPVEDSAPEPQIAGVEPEIAAQPEAPAPAVIAVAPNPSFSTAADAGAGGAPPRRLAMPQVQDAPAATDTADPPQAPEAPDTDVASAPADPPPALDAGTPRRLPQVAPPPVTPVVPQADAPSQTPLPQADVAMPAPDAAPDPAPPASQDVAAEPGPPDALRDHAVPFEADPLAPLMAVVLIDDPQTPLDPATLADLSFPVSFAIDPMRPDAAERAAAFRAAGFEVVILGATALPDGATPADVEVALAVAQERLPEAVALMDDAAGRIQGDRPVLDATVGALAATGHGLLAFPRGLNAAEETARRTGVPAATFFRLLDDEDQRAPVITRFLGRAAFAAAQEGAVVVAGRTRPDTVTALFSWALANRTEGVELAPVSAVLLRLSE